MDKIGLAERGLWGQEVTKWSVQGFFTNFLLIVSTANTADI